MIRFSKIFLYSTLLILLVWQLPWCYAFLTAKPANAPFILYSPIIDDFIVTQKKGDKNVVRFDLKDREYTQKDVDSLLPTFFMRQLVADERFPDTLLGVPVSPKEVQHASFTFRSTPSTVNVPQTGIYFLLESMSKRVDLEMPDDAFRFTKNGIEFINMNTNTVDTEKSTLFTDMLNKKGFTFPALRASGNPTTRKEYDEGYLVLDANRRLFHLKQTQGRPYVKAIDLPEGVVADWVFITEFRNRKTLGFLCDTEHRFYVIERDGTVVKAAIPGFDPAKDGITIFGNLFDWTVKVSKEKEDHFYALRASDYSLIKEYSLPNESKEIPGLSFTSPNDKFVRPRF